MFYIKITAKIRQVKKQINGGIFFKEGSIWKK